MKTYHQWTTFQKGRIKIQACACCGEMHLPSNVNNICEEGNLLSSTVIKAGYTIAAHLPRSIRTSQFAA